MSGRKLKEAGYLLDDEAVAEWSGGGARVSQGSEEGHWRTDPDGAWVVLYLPRPVRLYGWHLDDSDSLDAAWAEVEAALPEGWVMLEVSRRDSNYHCCEWDVMRPEWEAGAGRPSRRTSRDDGGRDIGQSEEEGGPTPAAALRALAAKLREQP